MILVASTPNQIANCAMTLGYVPSLNVTGITALEGDRHLATVLFDYWTYTAVQMHIWVEDAKVFEENLLNGACWGYLKQHGRTLAIGVTPSDNAPSLKLQKGLGFVEKYRIKDGWSEGVDVVITEKRLTDG